MKLGIIQGYQNGFPMAFYYYIYALTFNKNIEIVSDLPIKGSKKDIHIASPLEIENNTDFIMYHPWYIYWMKNKKNINVLKNKIKSKILIYDYRDSIFLTSFFNEKNELKNIYRYFKLSCPNDLGILDITNEEREKIRPLMYISPHINYSDFPLINFTREFSVSFIGLPTSKKRINTIKKIKDELGFKFYGGFYDDMEKTKKPDLRYDEEGTDVWNLTGEKLSPYLSPKLKPQEFLRLIKRSIINLSLPGWSSNTHRLIEILCMGGFSLSCDISHINQGKLKPEINKHYNIFLTFDDLYDKIEYFSNNPLIAENIGNNARKHMEETYFNPEKMAAEYILNEL